MVFKHFFSIIFCFSAAYSVAGESVTAFDGAKEMLYDARDKIYNFDKNDSIIEECIARSRTIFSALPEKHDRLFWTAQTEYFEGLYYLKKNSKKNAELHFNKCNAILTQQLKECGENSEAYSLLADSHMQLMLSKGLTYQLLNGQKLKTLPEKALRLDSANIRAYQSLAVYCMNAPEPLGGSIQKAIQILASLTSKDKGEMFKIYYLLGNAYMKIHDSMLASKYLQMALALYPENQWAVADLQTVNSRKKP